MPEDAAKEDLKSFQLKLPKELHHRLKVMAARQETTITDLILAAIQRAYPDDSGAKGGYVIEPSFSLCADRK